MNKEEEEEKEGVGRSDQAGGQSRRVGLNWLLWEADLEGGSQPRQDKEARVNEEVGGRGTTGTSKRCFSGRQTDSSSTLSQDSWDQPGWA